jgi:hypothetical protein
MLFRIERATRRQMVAGSPDGTGRSARKMELGRWVATMAWMLPRRFAREEAKTLPSVDVNLSCVSQVFPHVFNKELVTMLQT